MLSERVKAVDSVAALRSDNAPSLKSLAIRGSVWTLGAYGTSQLLRLGSNLVLAWLLVPEAFGLMLLVNMVMQGLQMFSDIGIGPSIIQSEHGREQRFLNTAWTIQVIRGFVLWIIACILAFPLAMMFARNDPTAWQLVQLIPVTGLMAVVAGFFSTNLYSLNRNLAMGWFSMVQLTSQGVGVVVMVGWALLYPSVWALVAGGLASHVCKLILSHSVIPGRRNTLGWDSDSARALFRFGKWITLSTAVAFLALQADRILLGNFVPMHVLGVYSLGLMVATLPREVLIHLTGLVLFPVLSEHQRSNRASLPEKMQRARGAILPAALVLVLGVILLAPYFFELLYPQAFHGAGWMAQIVSASVWCMVLAATTDRALLAVGNSRALAAGNIMNLLTTIPAAIGGFYLLGVSGLLIGYAVGAFMNLLAIQYSAHQCGMAVVLQDIRLSLILASLVLLGLILPRLFGGTMAAELVVACLMLLGATIWAMRCALPIVRTPSES